MSRRVGWHDSTAVAGELVDVPGFGRFRTCASCGTGSPPEEWDGGTRCPECGIDGGPEPTKVGTAKLLTMSPVPDPGARVLELVGELRPFLLPVVFDELADRAATAETADDKAAVAKLRELANLLRVWPDDDDEDDEDEVDWPGVDDDEDDEPGRHPLNGCTFELLTFPPGETCPGCCFTPPTGEE